MGIPQFYKKIKKKCPNAIIENNNKFINNKWDYIFVDFQSMIYSTYYLFSNEINYFYRLIYYINYTINNNIKLNINIEKCKLIIDYIMTKYEIYFINLYGNDYYDIKLKVGNFDVDIINKFILNLDNNNNDENIIIDTLTEYVVSNLIELSDNHIETDNKYNNTYIFFDGIPSKSKIKEQIGRRIYPEILKYIKLNLLKNTSTIEFELNKILLNDNPPSIGIDKPIIHKINNKLKIINDPIKGKFNINKLDSYGEAEHQIMTYLNDYLTLYKNTTILLISPDADLILLSIINNTKNLNIDILKLDVNVINIIDNYEYNNIDVISPFYYKYNYIYIKEIIKCLELNTYQEQLDISYLLLLLGDDFLPIVPNLTIDSLDSIIKIYKNLI